MSRMLGQRPSHRSITNPAAKDPVTLPNAFQARRRPEKRPTSEVQLPSAQSVPNPRKRNGKTVPMATTGIQSVRTASRKTETKYELQAPEDHKSESPPVRKLKRNGVEPTQAPEARKIEKSTGC